MAFLPRPDVGRSTYPMVNRARAEGREKDWLRWLGEQVPDAPTVFVGPIAAGEKVVASTRSPVFQFLRSEYSDALAVEMEGRGFLEAVYSNPGVDALVIRGISDLIENKSSVETTGSQEMAARNASAFGFQILASLAGEPASVEVPDITLAAAQVREALDPHVLPRIERAIVSDKLIPAVLRGVRDSRQRVVCIVGPAGYGKSTILGTMYDDLVREGISWVSLVRCNDIALGFENSVEGLDQALGEAASGRRGSIAQIARVVAQVRGRGVLLIDTLDLLLSERLVAPLRGVLLRLAETGTTVVLTCRDFEYNAFLEPSTDKLPGLSTSIDRYNVPPFSTEEVKLAAIAFVNSQPELSQQTRNETFANGIVRLSTDNRPLQEITHNPLLLGMLCELFGRDGSVPRDLSVNRLYAEYWRRKVTASRKHGPGSAVAMRKEQYCLRIARALYQLSDDRLLESLYESDLDTHLDETLAAARAELLSDDVLDYVQQTGRTRFFHQTFLEYAIARWLVTESGKPERDALFGRVRSAESGIHWWPIVRQVLTSVEEGEFDRLVDILDLSRIEAFRSAALAAAARLEGNRVSRLLSLALTLGSQHQKALFLALHSTASVVRRETWHAILLLLEHGDSTTASRLAQAVGELLQRSDLPLDHGLDSAMAAIERRPAETSVERARSREIMWGWMVRSCMSLLQSAVDVKALEVLRQRYASFGIRTQLSVVLLHLALGVPRGAVRELLAIIVGRPLPTELRQAASDLLERFERARAAEEHDALVPMSIKGLHGLLSDGWSEVMAGVLGRLACDQPDLLSELVQNLLLPDNRRPDLELQALREVIRQGAAHKVLALILESPLEHVLESRFVLVSTLVSEIARAERFIDADGIARRLQNIAVKAPEVFARAYAALTDRSELARKIVPELVAALPVDRRAPTVTRIIRELPAETVEILAPELGRFLATAESDRAQNIASIRLFGALGRASREAVSALVERCASSSMKVALAAGSRLVLLVGSENKLSPSDLLSLAQSRFQGVRLHWLEALSRMLELRQPFSEQDLVAACKAAVFERSDPVVRLLLSLVANWVRENGRAPGASAEVVGAIALRLVGRGQVESGMLRSLIIALKTIAQTEELGLQLQLRLWTVALIRSTDLRRGHGAEPQAIDLLSALARLDPTFLGVLVADSSSFPVGNLRALVLAIRRVDGVRSPLLDEVLGAPWCDSDTKALVLGWRGA